MPSYFHQEEAAQDIHILYFNAEDREANVLCEKALRELDQLLDQMAAQKNVKGLVIMSSRKDQFIAGADIREIEKFKTANEAEQGSRAIQAIFNKISKLSFPTVAAIHGPCLGGGLELALACRWRVATDAPETVLALPEIQLGLIPGGGGTQRLPRLIGIQAALDMILTGKRVKAKKAEKLGLIDTSCHVNQLRDIALQFAARKTRVNKGWQIQQALLEKNPIGRLVMQKKAREMVDKNTKGFYPAPYKALDAVFKGIEKSLEKGLELEARYFGELVVTPQSQSLIHLFHATTAVKKHPADEACQRKFADAPLQQIGVIGSGFMGAGIATVCADKGLRVLLSDPSSEAIGRALRHSRQYFEKKWKQRRIKEFEVDQKMNHISPATSPLGFNRAQIVIEAVFEDLSLKQDILQSLESASSDDWIFASNTSAIPIKEISAKAQKPERVLGMHFFSPVEKMPLLEIVVTDKTADWVIGRARQLGKLMNKQIIVVQDGPGFYTTRALAFYLNEAALMLAEGARIDKLDKALTDFGFPVGPITLIDEVGIDVGYHVLETMQKAFGDRIEVPPGIQVVLDSGRLGRKNKKGFYLYEGEKKTDPDPAIYEMLESFKTEPKGIPSDEMVDRCLLVFINESVRCLEEGILASAYDGDVGAVFGLGFPPFWGGPFCYVDHIGADVLVERLTQLAEKFGPRFEPAPLLKKYAQSKQRFFPDEKRS